MIKEKLKIPAYRMDVSLMCLSLHEKQLEIDAETQNGGHPSRSEEAFFFLAVEPEIRGNRE